MPYSLDVSSEYQKSKSKFFRYSLIFALIFAAVLLVDTLLVVLTKEEYIAALIVSIVVTILFSWFAIFFFLNIYNDINSRYRFFKGFDSGEKPVEDVAFLYQSSDMEFVNGLYVYGIKVSYVEHFITKEKIIYSLDKDLDFKEGDKLLVTTYRRIIVNAEKHA